MQPLKFILFAILFVSILIPGAPVSALGNTITVNTAADEDVSNGSCSLREAILAANTNAAYHGCAAGVGTDTIGFSADYTITLSSTLPSVATTIIIQGNGATNTIIQASTCNPVTLPGSCIPANYGVFEVSSSGRLTLNNLKVRHGNTADVGGGIYSQGFLKIIDSTVASNSAPLFAGGGIYSSETGTLILTRAIISKNTVSTFGAGIYSLGSLQIRDSTISDNYTTTNGGRAAGIYALGTNTIDNTSIIGNVATYGSGGLLVSGMTTISNSVISGNSTGSYGGGLETFQTVNITNTTISGNSSTRAGGGISNDSSGILTITNSTMSGNSANVGGAIMNNGQITISSSTLSGNWTHLMGIFDDSGGGIFNAGSASLDMTNSTISGNSSDLYGGGIFIDSGGTFTSTNSTFSGNRAMMGAGVYNAGTLNYRNTILADSIDGGDCLAAGGTIGTNLNNLVEDGSCSPALSGDPKLGMLANNGGSTLTHALLYSSPVIEQGTNVGCPATDQRGVPRPQGAACEIGAYETAFQIYRSQGANDGWVLESTEESNLGGTLSSAGTSFYVGDDAADRQYRAILAFNTSGLPDAAVITRVMLRVKKRGLVGTNLFSTHQGLKVDIRKPFFGSAAALALNDFIAGANMNGAATFIKTPDGQGWYSAILNSSAHIYVNKLGSTQLRLRFSLGDNDDQGADYLKFYSGNDVTAAYRPQLIIEYYLP